MGLGPNVKLVGRVRAGRGGTEGVGCGLAPGDATTYSSLRSTLRRVALQERWSVFGRLRVLGSG